MLGKTLALLNKLKANEGNKADIAAIETQITAEEAHEANNETIKTEHATYKQTHDALGDRDLGKLIGFSDALKEIDLDTAEKVITLKSKADGADKTITQLKDEALAFQSTIDKGSTDLEALTASTTKKLLLGDAKLRLKDEAGHVGNFNRALDELDTKGAFTRVDGNILFNGNKLDTMLEEWRETYGDGFKPAPSGTDEHGGGDGNRPNENKNDGSIKSVVDGLFK